MKTSFKIAIALAVVAVPLIAISASMNTATSSTELPPSVGIGFSVYPDSDAIVVERGKPTSIPLKIEGPDDVTTELKIRAAFERGNADPEKLQTALTRGSVQLSAQDVSNGKAAAVGENSAKWDAGEMSLNALQSLQPGTYTFALEVEQPSDGKLADKLVSGTIVTVEVK